jgi:hypothetical protein
MKSGINSLGHIQPAMRQVGITIKEVRADNWECVFTKAASAVPRPIMAIRKLENSITRPRTEFPQFT